MDKRQYTLKSEVVKIESRCENDAPRYSRSRSDQSIRFEVDTLNDDIGKVNQEIAELICSFTSKDCGRI